MAPKRKAEAVVPAAETTDAEPPAKRGRGRPRVKPIVVPAPLPPVTHPSHGKVAGSIFVMGDADCGQLGLGEDITEKLRPGPLRLEGEKKVLQVAAGGMHSVALDEDGCVWSWGVNDEGALGRETAGEVWEKYAGRTGVTGDSYVPGRVAMPAGAGRVVQLSAGDSHTVALTEEGVVYAWGTFRSDAGVMGFNESTRLQLVPVKVLALRSIGRGADRIAKITSGADHVAALSERGRLYTWGSGLQGQLGRLGPRAVDGKVREMLTPAQVRLPPKLGKAFADVDCGTYCTLAWTTGGGRLTVWGLNNYGQLGVEGSNVLWVLTEPPSLKGHAPVAWAKGGQHHTLVALAGGRGMLSMGRPTYGRLGRSGVDVTSDEPVPAPGAVEGLEGIELGGGAAGLAVSGAFGTGANELYMWGFGTSSQLGKGDDDEDEVKPARVKQTKAWNAQRVLGLEIGGQHVLMLCTPAPTQA
mmetsp:Transcript_34102/g.85402  ORF Transcript_34102/g.85402 Transcript_34102/m.85402 type:complete len:469 (-) Transcript_34102:211-1617(-)